MGKKVEIPSMGESVTEAILVRWIKKEGDTVAVDDPICELETDKANVEIPSPVAGVVHHLKKEGDTVKVGDAIADINEVGAQKPASKPPTASAPTAREPQKEAPARDSENLSPSVRRAVKELNVDPSKLEGTGPRGRIIKEDVLQAAGKPVPTPPPPTSPNKFTPTPMTGGFPIKPKSTTAGDGIRREPMTKIRKKIAERLVTAKRDTAMLTTFNEVDMTEVLSLREKYKARFTETYGVPLGLMSFFARACVVALHEFPVVNAFIDGEDILFHDNVHLGIAVSTERGLVVPVLKNTDNMSFAKIETEIKRMATAAREGKLGLDELGGGTFTITNGGVFGSLLSTPILNPPQSGILGLHAIQKRPVALNDKVEIRPMMYLALSYDHRLVDGKDSVSFLVRLKNLLEDPSRLMLEV
jgi:2-oxoglutarate dehydrogenase E2 component (dihydrolipoamide succinyltransferase)